MLDLFGADGGEPGQDWESKAIAYLEAAGYVEVGGAWRPKPGVEDLEDMTSEEWACMRYLMEEWDFGLLRGGAGHG